MAVIREYQRRMDEIFQSPWMKQQAQLESILRQFNEELSVLRSIQPTSSAISKNLKSVLQSLPDASTLAYFQKEQAIMKLLAPFYDEQSALLAHLPKWDTFQDKSLAAQKKYAVAHVRTLTENISSVVVGEDEEAPLDLPAELSTEDEQIIANEVSSILSTEKNWEQRLMDSMVRLKETHPILATVLCHLFFPLLLGLLVNLISTSIGEARTPAKVYEQPRPTAPIVYHLERLQQVRIIGEEPYYFQIELIDNETKEILTGFVSKRSLKEIEDSEDSSASN